MIRKLLHILSGWGKHLGLLPVSKAEAKLSALRLDQCNKCAHSKESKVLTFLNGHADYQKQIVCGKCGCPCLQKSLAVDEKCPIGKW